MPRRSRTVIDVVWSSCDTKMLDMQHVESADRTNGLGAVSVPAIIIDKETCRLLYRKSPDIHSLEAGCLGLSLT